MVGSLNYFDFAYKEKDNSIVLNLVLDGQLLIGEYDVL